MRDLGTLVGLHFCEPRARELLLAAYLKLSCGHEGNAPTCRDLITTMPLTGEIPDWP